MAQGSLSLEHAVTGFPSGGAGLYIIRGKCYNHAERADRSRGGEIH